MNRLNPIPVRTILLGEPDNFPKIPKHRAVLAIIVIVLSGALGWGGVRLVEAVNSRIAVKIADHGSHRPPPPPLPTSPFR